MRLVDLAHQEVSPFLNPGDIAIDATVGNGYDTAFLAERVGKNGTVYGFDVQEMALEVATMVLKSKKCFQQCELIEKPHEEMLSSIPEKHFGKASVVMFNLGYLPHGDKTIVTTPDSTTDALEQSFQILKTSGVLSILSYRGHPGGLEEFNSVSHWIKDKGASLSVVFEQDSDHPQSTGPYMWLLQKQ